MDFNEIRNNSFVEHHRFFGYNKSQNWYKIHFLKYVKKTINFTSGVIVENLKFYLFKLP